MNIKCAQCGIEFSCPPSQASRRTCCSFACYTKYRKGRTFTTTTATCERCGTPFSAKTGNVKYCSRKCWRADYKEATYTREKPCLRCGKSFKYPPEREDRAKYCSHECQTSHKTEMSLVDKTCPTCGASFREIPSGNDYCSKKCGRAAIAKANSKGGHLHKSGYRLIRVDGRSMPEHRYVMEQFLGRKLHAHEHVHHKNGQRSQNDMGNLELWVTTNRQPKGQRLEDVIAYWKTFLELYGYTVTKHSATPVPPSQADGALVPL